MDKRLAMTLLWLATLEILLFGFALLGLVMFKAVVLLLALLVLVALQYAVLEHALVKRYEQLVCWLVLEAIFWLDQIDLLDD